MVNEQSAIVELWMEAEVDKHERGTRVARGVVETTLLSLAVVS